MKLLIRMHYNDTESQGVSFMRLVPPAASGEWNNADKYSKVLDGTRLSFEYRDGKMVEVNVQPTVKRAINRIMEYIPSPLECVKCERLLQPEEFIAGNLCNTCKKEDN